MKSVEHLLLNPHILFKVALRECITLYKLGSISIYCLVIFLLLPKLPSARWPEGGPRLSGRPNLRACCRTWRQIHGTSLRQAERNIAQSNAFIVGDSRTNRTHRNKFIVFRIQLIEP